ncbi:juvenile hormone acid O-methyltransferase-like [Pieris napi]|uniref:juvenile hormone acid O-methyltransferase-like n=1 Tax=Pieris napi TaxID=78633 RepID=UPI001FB99991|nr:juvenile hormone acid O-methyltransferase-like [Pieris napi]
MNNAELYQKSNNLQKRDALECLQDYARKIKWKKDVSVIDIGCGDGSVTTAITKKFLPNCKEVVGCDISEQMIHFANKKFSSETTSFMVLDIEGDLPEQMRAEFHHAFSFYTLHWIKQQEHAFKNIYDLLQDGGNCFLIFLGHMPLFDVFRILARSNRWSLWLRDVDKFVSPYHDSQDPDKEIKRMMCKIGFTNVEVQYKPKSFIYNSLEAVKKAVKAVNPFKIPDELHEELLEDYISIVRDMQLIDIDNNNLEQVVVRTNYNLIIAYGEK